MRKYLFYLIMLTVVFSIGCSRVKESSVEETGSFVVLHDHLKDVISSKIIYTASPVVFYQTDTIKKITFKNGNWVEKGVLFYGSPVSVSGDWDVTTCIDDSVWFFFQNREDKLLYVGKLTDDKWDFQTLDEMKFSSAGVSLSGDCYETPAVAVRDPYDNSVYYYYMEDNKWNKETILKKGEAGKYLSFKKGFGDYAYLAFNNGSTGTIGFAERKGKNDWAEELIPIKGDRVSLSIGDMMSGDISTIYPRVAVRGLSGYILYNTKSGSDWNTQVINVSDSYVGTVELLSNGVSDYVVFSDTSWQDINVAYKKGNYWLIDPVVTAGSVGYALSSAIFDNYIVGVSYNISKGELFYFKTVVP